MNPIIETENFIATPKTSPVVGGKITYNRENYSGKTADVVIHKNGTFKDSVFGKGTWTHEQLDPTCAVIKVTIDGVPFRAYQMGDKSWYAENYDMSRDDSNGIVACLKLANNTM